MKKLRVYQQLKTWGQNETKSQKDEERMEKIGDEAFVNYLASESGKLAIAKPKKEKEIKFYENSCFKAKYNT